MKVTLKIKTWIDFFLFLSFDIGDFGSAQSPSSMQVAERSRSNRSKKTNDWIRLQEIFVSLEEQEKTLYDMDSIQLNFVQELAYKYPPDRASFSAQAVLHYLFGEEVPECEIMTTRRTTNLVKDVVFVTPEDDAYIEDNFPDPFIDKTTVNYYLPEGSIGKITIIDMFGQIIEEFELPEGENSFEITSKDWAPGVYSYTYFVNGKIIDYKKMVITQ